MEFPISTNGLHEFQLQPEKRDIIEPGDVIGLLTCSSTERSAIWHDIRTCDCSCPTLEHPASGVTTPLGFNVATLCHHFNMRAYFVGNEKVTTILRSQRRTLLHL